MCRHKLALATLLFVVLALLLCPQRLLASETESAGSAVSPESAAEGALLAVTTRDGTGLNRNGRVFECFFCYDGKRGKTAIG